MKYELEKICNGSINSGKSNNMVNVPSYTILSYMASPDQNRDIWDLSLTTSNQNSIDNHRYILLPFDIYVHIRILNINHH